MRHAALMDILIVYLLGFISAEIAIALKLRRHQPSSPHQPVPIQPDVDDSLGDFMADPQHQRRYRTLLQPTPTEESDNER